MKVVSILRSISLDKAEKSAEKLSDILLHSVLKECPGLRESLNIAAM